MFDITTMLGFHTWISLIMLVLAVPMCIALLNRRASWATAPFIAAGVATSVTGFLLPASGFLPSHGVGLLSLVVLAAVLLAGYVFHQAGIWRAIFAGGLVAALYLDAFVAVVQAFQKIPALNALAPTGTEAPFLIVQLIALAAFAAIGFLAVRRSRLEARAI